MWVASSLNGRWWKDISSRKSWQAVLKDVTAYEEQQKKEADEKNEQAEREAQEKIRQAELAKEAGRAFHQAKDVADDVAARAEKA